MGKKIGLLILSFILVMSSCSKNMTTTQIRENSIRINALEVTRMTLEELIKEHPEIIVQTPSETEVILQVPEVALKFDFDKSDVKPEYTKILTDLAIFINTNDYVLDLVGHTDAKGTDEYNNKLSMRRVQSVKAKLLELGLEPSRIDKLEGKGESQPIATNETPEGRAENRRMEFKLRKR